MPPVNGAATPPSPTPPPNVALQWFREGVTAAIALGITVVTLCLLVGTFRSASETAGPDKDAAAAKTDAFNREKDVLLYGLALLGAVTGYYLGRVPAELHAQAAQNTARLAEQQKDQAKQGEAKTKAEVKTGLKQLSAQLGAASPMAAAAQAKSMDPIDAARSQAETLAQARASVEALLERVS